MDLSPHSNCPHADTGWCQTCVQMFYFHKRRTEEEFQELEKELADAYAKIAELMDLFVKETGKAPRKEPYAQKVYAQPQYFSYDMQEESSIVAD